MGRIVLCSEDYIDVISPFNTLVKRADIYTDFGRVIAYKKINVDTQNYFRNKDEWIVGVGIFIYKENRDRTALRYILEDFVYEEVEDLRGNILGSYCIVIYKNSKTYVFVDNLGDYKVYYHIKDNKIILTNTWYHIMRCLSLPEIDSRINLALLLNIRMNPKLNKNKLYRSCDASFLKTIYLLMKCTGIGEQNEK